MPQVRFTRPLRIGLTSCALAVACLGLRAQGTLSSDRPVSPTVVASWLVRGDKLSVLVLWRGTPGWFWRVDGGHGGGGGSTGQRGFQQIRYGESTFQIDYDFGKETATIAGRDVSLREVNVVMVDFVDSASGPTVVDTRYIDPRVPAGFDAGLTFIGREPSLYPFLQCDLSLPASPGVIAQVQQMQQALITMMCNQLRSR